MNLGNRRAKIPSLAVRPESMLSTIPLYCERKRGGGGKDLFRQVRVEE